jgi:hypothetical protein
METALQCYAEAVGSALGAASRTYSRLFHRAQENASYVRERYPLEALGAIAATAFVVGIVLRVWRAKSS